MPLYLLTRFLKYNYSAARPEQVFYGGEVKGESAMTYFDDVGTRVIHTYQVRILFIYTYHKLINTWLQSYLVLSDDYVIVLTCNGKATPNGEIQDLPLKSEHTARKIVNIKSLAWSIGQVDLSEHVGSIFAKGYEWLKYGTINQWSTYLRRKSII